MKRKLVLLSLLIFFILPGCLTVSSGSGSRYAGVYESPKSARDSFSIEYKEGLYHISYHDPENEWEGVGYERNGRIVAVLRHLEEEDDAEFLVISFPGNDQLFVVARNLEGDYLRDEYFQKVD